MWPNTQFPAELVIITEKSLMKTFIFCAVLIPSSLRPGHRMLIERTFLSTFNLRPVSGLASVCFRKVQKI